MTDQPDPIPTGQEAWGPDTQTGVLTPGCDCGHAGMGANWHPSDCAWRTAASTPTPAPTALRDLYAAAIALYDHAVGQATNPAPSGHHYGQADAVLAVRDRELEQLRAQANRWQRGHETAEAQLVHERRANEAARRELEQLRARVRRVADLIENGAPWTANRQDTAARVWDAVRPQDPS